MTAVGDRGHGQQVRTWAGRVRVLREDVQALADEISGMTEDGEAFPEGATRVLAEITRSLQYDVLDLMTKVRRMHVTPRPTALTGSGTPTGRRPSRRSRTGTGL